MRSVGRNAALLALLILLPFAPVAPAAASKAAPLYRYLEIEADYADWGSNERELEWDAEGWLGGDEGKAWLKSEGTWADGDFEEAELQLLYSRPIADFWDIQGGLRHDSRPHPTNYLAVALNGLAPYFFETDLSLFLSDEGDVSARADLELDLLITQQLILQPYAETDFFFQDVAEQEVGAGLAELDTGVRLRYEIEREFAPYVDFNYQANFGETRQIARAAGENPSDFTIRLGLRFWLN